MGRAIAWVVGGLVALVLLVVLTAPEVAFGDAGGTTWLVALVLLAGLPGLALLALIAARRHRTDADDRPDPR
jgi:hypothetical protein